MAPEALSIGAAADAMPPALAADSVVVVVVVVSSCFLQPARHTAVARIGTRAMANGFERFIF
jgi:hypothetical protein